MASFFNNAESEKWLRQWYWERLDALGQPYESISVETSFGDTQLIISGRAEGPPLILLHAENSCSAVALTALSGLLDRYRVYAIDIVGEPNLSAPVRPAISKHAYGQWMFEIQSRLRLQGAQAVGISFGAFVLMKSLIFNPSAFSMVYLITPLGWVERAIDPSLATDVIALEAYERTRQVSFRTLYLQALLTNLHGIEAQFLRQILGNFQSDKRQVPLIDDESLCGIQIPLHLILTEEDNLVPEVPAYKRWLKHFSTTSQCLSLPSSRHVPEETGHKQVVKFIATTSENTANNKTTGGFYNNEQPV